MPSNYTGGESRNSNGMLCVDSAIASYITEFSLIVQGGISTHYGKYGRARDSNQ